ncbi:hypothetical protein ACTMTR_11655, partial [Klebsiella pneumoniae]
WRRLLENSLSAKVSCWLIRLLILGSGYNTMISHLGLIRTFLNVMMHLHQLSPEGISDRKVIVENRDYLFDDLINSMQKSSSLWDGRVKEYLAVRKYLQS